MTDIGRNMAKRKARKKNKMLYKIGDRVLVTLSDQIKKTYSTHAFLHGKEWTIAEVMEDWNQYVVEGDNDFLLDYHEVSQPWMENIVGNELKKEVKL